jgi:hypothetical protein
MKNALTLPGEQHADEEQEQVQLDEGANSLGVAAAQGFRV